VHPLLGRGWQLDGQPISEHDVGMAIAQQSSIMKGLDLIDSANWLVWNAGASATMLAEIWTNHE